MAKTPLTWQSVTAPDFSSSAALLRNSQDGFIKTGEYVSKMFDDYEKMQLEKDKFSHTRSNDAAKLAIEGAKANSEIAHKAQLTSNAITVGKGSAIDLEIKEEDRARAIAANSFARDHPDSVVAAMDAAKRGDYGGVKSIVSSAYPDNPEIQSMVSRTFGVGDSASAKGYGDLGSTIAVNNRNARKDDETFNIDSFNTELASTAFGNKRVEDKFSTVTSLLESYRGKPGFQQILNNANTYGKNISGVEGAFSISDTTDKPESTSPKVTTTANPFNTGSNGELAKNALENAVGRTSGGIHNVTIGLIPEKARTRIVGDGGTTEAATNLGEAVALGRKHRVPVTLPDGSKSFSSAQGFGQIVSSTMAGIAPEVFGKDWKNLPNTTENQLALVNTLIDRRMNENKPESLSNEWAGFKRIPGAGNPKNWEGISRDSMILSMVSVESGNPVNPMTGEEMGVKTFKTMADIRKFDKEYTAYLEKHDLTASAKTGATPTQATTQAPVVNGGGSIVSGSDPANRASSALAAASTSPTVVNQPKSEQGIKYMSGVKNSYDANKIELEALNAALSSNTSGNKVRISPFKLVGEEVETNPVTGASEQPNGRLRDGVFSKDDIIKRISQLTSSQNQNERMMSNPSLADNLLSKEEVSNISWAKRVLSNPTKYDEKDTSIAQGWIKYGDSKKAAMGIANAATGSTVESTTNTVPASSSISKNGKPRNNVETLIGLGTHDLINLAESTYAVRDSEHKYGSGAQQRAFIAGANIPDEKQPDVIKEIVALSGGKDVEEGAAYATGVVNNISTNIPGFKNLSPTQQLMIIKESTQDTNWLKKIYSSGSVGEASIDTSKVEKVYKKFTNTTETQKEQINTTIHGSRQASMRLAIDKLREAEKELTSLEITFGRDSTVQAILNARDKRDARKARVAKLVDKNKPD